MNPKYFLCGILLLFFLLTGISRPAFADSQPASFRPRAAAAQRVEGDPDIVRRVNANARANCNPFCPDRTASALPRPLAFETMWSLILKHQRARHSHFSPELIACLFWEESGFRMVEHPRSGAVGFGQVLPITLVSINKKFGTQFTPADLLRSPDASVEASVLALELAWEWKHDKVKALYAYAGGVRHNTIVHKWLTAEAAMKQGKIPYAASFGMDAWVRDSQIRALRVCSQPGYDPQVIFD